MIELCTLNIHGAVGRYARTEGIYGVIEIYMLKVRDEFKCIHWKRL